MRFVKFAIIMAELKNYCGAPRKHFKRLHRSFCLLNRLFPVRQFHFPT